MKFLLTVLFILCTQIAAFAAPSTETTRIAEVYQAYRTALLTKDGAAAWQLVDQHTQKKYHQAVQDSLHLQEADLKKLDPLYAFMILRTRMAFPLPALQKQNGKTLFITGVEKGWISKASIQALEKLDKIVITRDTAQGFMAKAPKVPLFDFVKEDKSWKLALWQNIKRGNLAMAQIAQAKHLTNDELLNRLLQQVNKGAIDARIYQGPLP